jgi:hypothetical protein
MQAFEYHDPEHNKDVKVDAKLGYEGTDVKVSGIVVFLTALGIFVVVTALVCVVIGKGFNYLIAKEDGPVTKWNHPVDVKTLGNLATSPALQQQFATLTQTFPTPRLQTDDGYQEIADIHAKEDLLLENYSYVDKGKGTVRIPIERAMELIAERGLPVVPATQAEKPLTEAELPVVKAPLTNGFARTGYEQEQMAKSAKYEPKE